MFDMQKPEWRGYQAGKKIDTLTRFDKLHERGGQTVERQTDGHRTTA